MTTGSDGLSLQIVQGDADADELVALNMVISILLAAHVRALREAHRPLANWPARNPAGPAGSWISRPHPAWQQPL